MDTTASMPRASTPPQRVPFVAFRRLFFVGPIGGMAVGLLAFAMQLIQTDDGQYVSSGFFEDSLGFLFAVLWILALLFPYLLFYMIVVTGVHALMTGAGFGLARLLVRRYPQQRGRLLLSLLLPVALLMFGLFLPGDIAFVQGNQQPDVGTSVGIVRSLIVLNFIFLPYICFCIHMVYRRKPAANTLQTAEVDAPPIRNSLITTPQTPEAAANENAWRLPH